MSDPVFRVRAHRPETRMPGEAWPKILPGFFKEPAEAADEAEVWLRRNGKDGQSFCDLLFNGDNDAHSSIFRISYSRYGVWNRDGIPWPIEYVDPETGEPEKLFTHPHFFAFGEDDLPPAPVPSDEGKHKAGDSKTMKIDGEDDEDEIQEDDESDEAADEDEGDGPEPEEYDDDEIEDEEEESDEDEEAGSEEEPDARDEGSEEGEDENPDPGEDDGESDDEGGADGEGEEDGDDRDDEEDDEEDVEMPRLTIFAKMRGPKGWRKRADAEDLNERNVFGLKIGVVDAGGETPGQQEKNVRAEIQFVESDDQRAHGTLRIKLPDGITPDDFIMSGRWISVGVPYTDEA